MDQVETGAADVDGGFAFDIISSLPGVGGIVLGAEAAVCVTTFGEADVEGRESAN